MLIRRCEPDEVLRQMIVNFDVSSQAGPSVWGPAHDVEERKRGQ